MTVATTETYIEYAGDNSSTVFALDFPFVDATCLKAVKIDGAGVSTPVTITDTTGGSQRTGWGVTISAPVGTGHILRIYRDTPMIQPKVYTENDPFPGRSHEIGLDRLTMIVQELRNALASGTFSGNPVTFIEGDELTITPILERGQIGVATDSRVILFKLQDGTVLRLPIDGAAGGGNVLFLSHNARSVTVTGSGIDWIGFDPDSVSPPNVLIQEIGEWPAYPYEKGFEFEFIGRIEDANPLSAVDFSLAIVEKANPSNTLYSIATKVYTPLEIGDIPFVVSGRVIPQYSPSGGFFFSCIMHSQTIGSDKSENISNSDLFMYSPESFPEATLRIGIIAGSGAIGYKCTVDHVKFTSYEGGGGGSDAQLIGDAGGDLSGTYPNPTVVGIRGESVPSLTAGFLSYTGTEWAFAPLSAFDFVKRPGDSMTGKLEFKDGESDEEPGSIEKTVGMGFNYLDIQQAGINANIQISTENNSGVMTEKINIGPNGVDLKESIFVQDELAIGASASFLTPYVDFRNQAEPDQVQSRTFWDADNLTLTTMLRDSGGPGTKLQHGQEIMIPCFNDSGVAIPSFRAVYISGSQGDKLKIDLADPTDPAKTQVIGVTTEEIPDQAVGFVTFFGEVRNEDTTAFTDGQEGFLSSAGGIIGTTVADGDTRVRIGYCRRSHASAGSFFVAPMRYPRIEDVTIDVWEDMPFLRGAKTGVSAPTYAQFGATAFWGWKMAAGNIFYHDDGQVNHKWNLAAILPHIHFSSDNGGTGSVTFEHRIMSRPASGGAWSTEVVATKSWSGTLAAGAGAPVLDLYDGNGFLPDFPGPSTLIKAVLTMTAKTFTGNIFIDGWDAHYKLNRLGTSTEY